MISCQLSDGRVVQFKNHTRLFIAQYTGLGMNWESTNAKAQTIEPGDWIGLENELAQVRRVTEIAD